MLAITRHGELSGRPPLLIAHGLFGSARNWGVVAKRLAEAGHPAVTVDMRNHGDSPWTGPHDYPAMAGDLAGVIEQSGGRANVLGHSMGGKAAMVLALTRPDLVERLIVADIAPVAYPHSQMRFLEAMRDLDLTGITRRSDADARLAERIDDSAIRAFLLQSLDVADGRWRLNLPQLERDMPAIMGFPDSEATFDGATLFLSGAASDYVRAEHRDRIRTLFPRAAFVKLPGAGHWLHAEQPRNFVAAVATFLDGPRS